MKVAVSFISSKSTFKETIKDINKTTANYIHVDVMDGKYVENNNFSKADIKFLLNHSNKLLDVHLMTKKPEKYLKYFKHPFRVDTIYFHPSSTSNPLKLIKKIKKSGIKIGIVINPDENVEDFNSYLEQVDSCLVMSVAPGAGGQDFIESTVQKILELDKYNLTIGVDGGINKDTISNLKNTKVSYVVSGSYICKSDNYEEAIASLK